MGTKSVELAMVGFGPIIIIIIIIIKPKIFNPFYISNHIKV